MSADRRGGKRERRESHTTDRRVAGERHREERSAKGRRVEGDRRQSEFNRDRDRAQGFPARRNSHETYGRENRRAVLCRRQMKDRRLWDWHNESGSWRLKR